VANTPRRAEEPGLAELAGEIIHGAETLIGQQAALLRSELRQELRQLEGAALAMSTGVALVATGGVLTAMMAVHASPACH